MNKLKPSLRQLFYYNPITDCYIRHNDNKLTSNYSTEFLYVFQTQYGEFNENDYKVVGYNIKNESDALFDGYVDNPNEGSICCCTHPIKNFYYIQNIKHNQTWLVGSECVKKVSYYLYQQTLKYKKQHERMAEGRICGYCENVLIDLRKKIQKKGYCDINCYRKSQYKINFGIHKGKILNEFVYTKKGFDYIQWVKSVLKKDRNAFGQYPLFLEIIEEIELELIV